MLFRKTLSGGLLAALMVLTSVEIGESGLNPTTARPDVTPGRLHIPMIVHQRHGKNTTSTNWSGYAVPAVSSSVSDVKASWVVPAIQGQCPLTNQYSSFW